MVIFILAAAAAFLLCVLIDKGSPVEERSPGDQDKQSPEDRFAKWLSKKARILPSILLLFLPAAVLFMLVAAAASPREFGFFLLSLPIFILFWGMWSLGNSPSQSEKIQSAEWRLLVISPLALVVLFEREDIVALVPEFIVWVAKWLGSVPWLDSVLLWLSSALPWFLATCTWLIAGAFYASLTNSANPPFKWLRGPWEFKWLPEQWQRHLVLGSLLFIALFSTLIARNGDAWAYTFLLAIRRGTSMPEAIYALLGVVAGLMCGNFSGWMAYVRSLGVAKPATSNESPPGNRSHDHFRHRTFIRATGGTTGAI